MDSSLLLLLGYSAAIVAASMLGGHLPTVVTMTHTRTQAVMSLVAGFILGIALYHLLPHGLVRIPGPGAVERAMGWMMLGVILMVLLLRIFHFHQHDFSGEAGAPLDHHDHGGSDAHSRSIPGIALGLGLHTVTEGVALGTSVRVGALHEGAAGLAGLGVFLAILMHKPLDAFSIIGLLQAAGHRRRARVAANIGFAALCPVVGVLTFWGVGLLGQWEGQVTGCAMAFAAGAFLCISLSDLLPEIHFHRHDRTKLTIAFLVGIGFAYALYFIESGAMHGLETPGAH